MQTITLTAAQISPVIEVGPGTRITSTGNGNIEWVAGSLADANNGSGTWANWPKGTSSGSVDVVRRMCIRATATGAMTVTIEEGKRDDTPDGAYWDSEFVTSQTVNGQTVLVGGDGSILVRPVVSYTWATRPAAADNTGVTIRITDIGGTAGSRWISDGTYWKPESGRVILAQSATAVTVPVQTAEYTAATIVIPERCMGTSGALEVTTTWQMTGSAKTCRYKFGSFTFLQALPGTNTSARYTQGIQNKNGLAAQIIGNTIGQGTFSANGATLVEGGIDTSSNVNLTITGTKTVDSDSMILVSYHVELIHA